MPKLGNNPNRDPTADAAAMAGKLLAFSGRHGGEARPRADRAAWRDLSSWAPSVAIQATVMLHVLVAVGLVLEPVAWPTLLGAVLGNYLLLGLAALWPRSRVLGPNLVRLPVAAPRSGEAAVAAGVVALSFDDGPDPAVTPLVLDLLDQHGATASFFCIGARARACPEIVRDIARRGHSVENHTERHPLHFALLGTGGMRREIETAQATLLRITGRPPGFFRAPAGFRNPLLDPVLGRTELRYTSWTRRGYDTVRRDPDAVLRHLSRGLRGGDIILLHDGHCARTREGQPVVLEVLPRLLEHLRRLGLRAVSLPRALASAEPMEGSDDA